MMLPQHETDPTEKTTRSLLGPMKIRKKLVLLHTAFSISLATILLLTVRPAILDIVARGEADTRTAAITILAEAPELANGQRIDNIRISSGAPEELGITQADAEKARSAHSRTLTITTIAGNPASLLFHQEKQIFLLAESVTPSARAAVINLYALVVVALLSVYLLIALTLEAFVLPKQVYGPIRALLHADLAVREGEREDELIPDQSIPSDELGEIMRSRNQTVRELRSHEDALADALEKLESVANDLKRKNHLLESVKQNMADQDRLVSLGLLSAGLAHELNTPLAVLKGCLESIAENPSAGVEPERAQLMLRVAHRLERLSESLLDFARVRPLSTSPVDIVRVVEEAWSLVRIDRDARNIDFVNNIKEHTSMQGDADRLSQVFVNLLRNAADAMNGEGRIIASAHSEEREGRRWLTVRCADTGPGIDPEVLPRLFEPFTSTRLDSQGTGLGLAVAEGIVREHGGVILAHNQHDQGAVFEVMLPTQSPIDPPAPSSTRTPAE